VGVYGTIRRSNLAFPRHFGRTSTKTKGMKRALLDFRETYHLYLHSIDLSVQSISQLAFPPCFVDLSSGF